MRRKRETVEVTGKPDVKPKPGGKIANPSEKLALLLRKEGALAGKVRKAQAELRAAQAEIAKLWNERENQSKELLSDNPEA